MSIRDEQQERYRAGYDSRQCDPAKPKSLDAKLVADARTPRESERSDGAGLVSLSGYRARGGQMRTNHAGVANVLTLETVGAVVRDEIGELRKELSAQMVVEDEILTMKGVTELLQVSSKTVLKWIRERAMLRRRSPAGNGASGVPKSFGGSESTMFARKRAGGKVVYYATAMYNGEQYNELVGTDKREALRVEARIRREIRDGVFQPKTRRTGAVTAARYAETWGAGRSNRTANDDRQRLRDYFVVHFGTEIRMSDIAERESLAFVRWLAELVRAERISARTARHIRGVVRTMFRDAKLEGVVASDPFAELPRKLLPKPARHERDVYSRDEVTPLLEDERVPAPVGVLLAMMLYMGVREGEACGRRWRDWDRDAAPLGAMSIASQYDGEPLKTDNARKVPVHPMLAERLGWWWREGFELTYCRKPAVDDFIVPNRHPRSQGHGAHTKSSAYKAMGRACEAVGVRFEGCHLTRHTMSTWARRGGARADVLERVTHNALGTIIDEYTHFDWEPLCEAVLCLDYAGKAESRAGKRPALALVGAASANATTQTAAEVAAVHVAPHVVPVAVGQKHEES